MDVLGYIASALGGGLFTALVFVVSQSNKISGMSTKLDGIVTQLNNHISSEQPTCSFHNTMNQTVTENKARIDAMEGRVGRLEQSRG